LRDLPIADQRREPDLAVAGVVVDRDRSLRLGRSSAWISSIGAPDLAEAADHYAGAVEDVRHGLVQRWPSACRSSSSGGLAASSSLYVWTCYFSTTRA
jgi:hypothetical protein